MYYDAAKDMRLGRIATPSRKETYKEPCAEPPNYGSHIEAKTEGRISILELQNILWNSLRELNDCIHVLKDRIDPVLAPVDEDESLSSGNPRPYSLVANDMINMNEYIGHLIEKVNILRARSEV